MYNAKIKFNGIQNIQPALKDDKEIGEEIRNAAKIVKIYNQSDRNKEKANKKTIDTIMKDIRKNGQEIKYIYFDEASIYIDVPHANYRAGFSLDLMTYEDLYRYNYSEENFKVSYFEEDIIDYSKAQKIPDEDKDNIIWILYEIIDEEETEERVIDLENDEEIRYISVDLHVENIVTYQDIKTIYYTFKSDNRVMAHNMDKYRILQDTGGKQEQKLIRRTTNFKISPWCKHWVELDLIDDILMNLTTENINQVYNLWSINILKTDQANEYRLNYKNTYDNYQTYITVDERI